MASSSRNPEAMEEDTLRFRIEEEDLEAVLVSTGDGEEGIDDRWCLVGKFLSNRVIDFEKIQNILASLWQPGMGMFVKQLDTNRFLFQFYHEVDIQRVINGSPWTYDRMQLIIERLNVGGDPKSLPLNTLDIWVQLHNVEPGFMTETTLRKVGNTMGKYLESDPKNFIGVWRDYLRMRITLNIEKPLRRRLKITKDDGTWFWINFKYERTPTFCFICGIIDHSDKYCPKLFNQPIDQIAKPYGEFMKALPPQNHKNVGSRWLRTKGWTPTVAMAAPAAGNGESSSVNAEDFSAPNPAVNVAAVQGNNYANLGGFNEDSRSVVRGNQGREIVQNKESDIIIYHDNPMLYDSKKRKVENEHKGGNADVEKTMGNISKNLSLAGLGNGARQSL
ncbi:uncharacterized protein LOC115695596 [Cannabis sativa]|uniref:uncharacterized protein LOC115695596 n=1 Tax=Cannabis sativa TaxID=3483 RepID=UPI0029C9DC9E|nr:uncharacterized protein LOC115695596 [Cannabis sativa]